MAVVLMPQNRCYALVAFFLALNFNQSTIFFNLFFVRWAKNIHIENQHFTNKITNK